MSWIYWLITLKHKYDIADIFVTFFDVVNYGLEVPLSQELLYVSFYIVNIVAKLLKLKTTMNLIETCLTCGEGKVINYMIYFKIKYSIKIKAVPAIVVNNKHLLQVFVQDDYG